jgi:sialate O-acetylesterase
MEKWIRKRMGNLMKGCLATVWSLLLSLGLGVVSATAEVRMPQIFSDHMVLLRDIPVRVWGWADVGEQVQVTFAGQHAKTIAGADGRWQVMLKKMLAQAAPQTLTIQGRNTVTFTDVLVGEVWLCSGQSNMERLLEQTIYSDADLETAKDAQLRYFHVLPATAVTPQEDVQRWDSQGWTTSTPEKALKFSAACFYFGRELRKHLKVPIGLIDSTKGGTRAQIWTSLETIENHRDADPQFRQWLEERALVVKNLAERRAQYPQKITQYDRESAEWTRQIEADPVYVAKEKSWQADLEQAQKNGTEWPLEPKPPLPKPTEPPLPDDGPYSTFMVGNLYNAMIAPLTNLSIRGILWYQGETNDKNAPQYKVLFPLLINDWRQHWREGNLPFLFVQLPNINRPQTEPVQDKDLWPWLREAQQGALVLPNTAMAVTIDIGDPWNVHGEDKRDIGIRLSLLARRKVYGEHIVAQGPAFRSMRVRRDHIELKFADVGSGLTIGAPPWTPTGVIPAPASELRGFAIAGDDRDWYWADARIHGKKVIVSSSAVKRPVAVRYGWADNPACNLYNLEQLPAGPFRTDDWQTTAAVPALR